MERKQRILRILRFGVALPCSAIAYVLYLVWRSRGDTWLLVMSLILVLPGGLAMILYHIVDIMVD